MAYRQKGKVRQRMQRLHLRDEQITPGVIFVYKLRPHQRPRHPEKEWCGKVLSYDKVYRRAMVVSLEEGYEGYEEDVWLEQIVRIETSAVTWNTTI